MLVLHFQFLLILFIFSSGVTSSWPWGPWSEPGDPVPWCRLACGRRRHWKCGTGLIPSSLMFCQLAHFKRGTLVKNIIFLLLTGHSKIAELSLALWASVCQTLPLTGLNGLAGKGDVSFPCCQFTVSPDHTESEDGRSKVWHHPLVSLELVWSRGLQLLLVSFFLSADGDACRLTNVTLWLRWVG